MGVGVRFFLTVRGRIVRFGPNLIIFWRTASGLFVRAIRAFCPGARFIVWRPREGFFSIHMYLTERFERPIGTVLVDACDVGF